MIQIDGKPMDEYFHRRHAWKPVTRREIVDILEIFIDKATFAQAMNALDENIKRAIQGAVLQELSSLMVAEQEPEGGPVSDGGIHLMPGSLAEK